MPQIDQNRFVSIGKKKAFRAIPDIRERSREITPAEIVIVFRGNRMKFVLVKAVAVLAACTSLVGAAEAKWLGNFTLPGSKAYIEHYPTAQEIANNDLPRAKATCKRNFPKSRSVSLKSYWRDHHFFSLPPDTWSFKSNWNCFDTSNGT